MMGEMEKEGTLEMIRWISWEGCICIVMLGVKRTVCEKRPELLFRLFGMFGNSMI